VPLSLAPLGEGHSYVQGMTTTYTIGPNGPTAGSAQTAIQQPGRKYPPCTIYNTGQATVYLSDESPINSTSGAPLTAGSVLPWDEDLALYAVCPTSTTLVTTANTQIPFDAGAIAAQILTQGLAQGHCERDQHYRGPPDRQLRVDRHPDHVHHGQ
jgi:hypothetical protein